MSVFIAVFTTELNTNKTVKHKTPRGDKMEWNHGNIGIVSRNRDCRLGL